MKTKLFKTYKPKYAAMEIVFVGAKDKQAFVRRAALIDFGKSTIAERSFAWKNGKRTLRIFRLENGDIGFRAFGIGIGNENIASRIFDDQEEAMTYLESIAASYINSDEGWEVCNI